MMTKKEIMDLAVKAGLDQEKFFAQLKAQGLNVAEFLQEEELDSVSGGNRVADLRSYGIPGDPGC